MQFNGLIKIVEQQNRIMKVLFLNKQGHLAQEELDNKARSCQI